MTSRRSAARSGHPSARGTRRHHLPIDPAPRPYDQSAEEYVGFFDERPRRRPDPFFSRVGALIVAGVLLAPVAAALGNDDSGVVTAPSGAAAVMVGPVLADAASPDAARPPTGDPTDGSTGAETTPAGPAVRAGALATAPAGSPAPRLATAAKVSTNRAACARRYRVRPGDYWIGIARRAEVPVRRLLRVNDAQLTTPVYPGDRICLPAGARRPGPPPKAAPAPAPAPQPTPTTRPPATTTPTTRPPTTRPPTTTTAPTTTAPTTTAPRPPDSYTQDQVLAIIREVWPDELEERAIQIAWRESNWIPTARNYCCHGLFQIYFNVHQGWLGWFGVTSPEHLYDPKVNAMAAYYLYQRAGGWGPWGG